MATSQRSFVQTLIGAIPAEDGAALMARAGEVARIMSSVGSVEVGTMALTAEAIDEMTVQLLPADQLQMFRESGTGQAEFISADGAGEFEVLAAMTDGDRWIEVRRQVRSQPQLPQQTQPQPPSEETLMAELLSRSPAKAAPAPPKAAVPAPVVAQAAVAPQPQAPKATPTVAAPEAADDLSPTGLDLEVPSSFPFANDQFDADDLSLPRGLLDESMTSSSPAEPVRPSQATRPSSVIPQIEATRSFSDRLREHGRLSILLPAIIVLVVGLPSAGWFMWTRRSTPAPVAAAPPSRPILKSRRLPNASMAQGLVAPISAANVSAQDVSAPPPRTEEPVAPTTPKAIAPAPAAHAASGSGFSIQVAAVHGRDEADRMAAKLVQAGYSSYVVSGDGASAGFYRVRVGAFADRQAAEDVARKIELAQGVKPWIVKEPR
jgi:hypothetical protein